VLPPDRRLPFAALGLNPPLVAPLAALVSEPPPSSGPVSLNPSLPLFELPAVAAAVSAGPAA
jgi:hypothetical protein